MTGFELRTFGERSDALPIKPQPLPQHFYVILHTVTFINLIKNFKKIVFKNLPFWDLNIINF